MSASEVPSRTGYSGSETAQMARVVETPKSAAEQTQSSRPAAQQPAATAKPAAQASGRRRARLVLTRVDPWSVMKLSFLLAIALGIVTLVAVGVLWNMLQAMGVFTSVSSTYQELTATEAGQGTDLMQYLGFERVMGAAGTLAAVNVVLITALSTLSAFLYNITTALVGGLHVTLTDDAS